MTVRDGYHVVSVGHPQAAKHIALIDNIVEDGSVKTIKFFGETVPRRVHNDQVINFGQQPQLYYHGYIDMSM